MLERYQRWLLLVGILTLLLGASLATARRSLRPLASTIQSTSPDVTLGLRLNEVLAFPSAGQQEWVELINLSDEVVALQGWILDDVEGAGSGPFMLDATAHIEPGALLRINTPNMYANFGSETVRLISSSGTEVDRFDFNGPEQGSSFGRIPDGLGPWFSDLAPTPGASNTPAPTPSATEVPSETATSSLTVTATPSPTETTTPSPTVTEPEPTPTPSATSTPSVTTVVATPTETSVAATPTETSVEPIPTETTIDPTPTETSVDPTPTETSIDPTFTEVVVATLTETSFPVETSTATTDPATPPLDSTPTETASPSPTLEDATPVDTGTETATPTVAATEIATPTAIVQSDIRLNEIVALPGEADALGWIEFYNLGTRNYDLTGWRLRAASGAEGIIGMGAILGPGEWLVLDLPVGFVLAADTIMLSTEDDQEVDRFEFDSSIAGRSWSRVPDGTGDWLGDRRPTRGIANSRDDAETGTPTIVLTPTRQPTLIPSVTHTPVPSSTPTPTLTPSTTSTHTPTITRTPRPTHTIVPTRTPSSTRTPTSTKTPRPTSTVTPSRTIAPTRTATQTRTIRPTPTASSTRTIAPTRTPTSTRTIAPTRTPTVTRTPRPSRTSTVTRTPTAVRTVTSTRTTRPPPTQTETRTPSSTRTPTVTRTPRPSHTATLTRTIVSSRTPSATRTVAPTRTTTPSRTVAPTRTPSLTRTLIPTRTATATRTAVPVRTPSATRTITRTRTPTATRTATYTKTPTTTRTATYTKTPTATRTATDTRVATSTPTSTSIPVATRTSTVRPTQTATRTPTRTRTTTPTRTTAPTRTPVQTRAPSPTRTMAPTTLPSPTRTTSPTRTSSPTRTATTTRLSSPPRTATRTATSRPTVVAGSSPQAPAPQAPRAPAGAPAVSVPETANVARGVAGSILIVEVLVDPAPGLPDPGGEWLLLRNVAGGAIRLEGWRLRDSQAETELPVIDLAAGASLLVTAHEVGNIQGLPAASQRLSLPGRIGNGLNNLGDSLRLVDAAGNGIDAMSWGTDGSVFNPAVTPEQPGTPIRRYGSADTNTAADWRKPAEAATPIVVGTGGVALAPPVSLPPAPTPALTPSASPLAGSTSSPSPMAGSTPAPSQVITPTPRRAGIAGAAEGGVVLGGTTPHAVILSEIAPRAGWIELYNRSTSPVDLNGWSLADATGAATLLLGNLPALPMHGFVVKADGLRLSQPALNLLLRRPDGSVADIVSVGRVEPDRSLSRYPAHGGGWTANTPLTAGSYNLPPEEQVEGASAAVTQANSQAAASSASVALSRWPLTLRILPALLGGLGVLALLLLLWRRGRGAPPVTPRE